MALNETEQALASAAVMQFIGQHHAPQWDQLQRVSIERAKLMRRDTKEAPPAPVVGNAPPAITDPEEARALAARFRARMPKKSFLAGADLIEPWQNRLEQLHQSVFQDKKFQQFALDFCAQHPSITILSMYDSILPAMAIPLIEMENAICPKMPEYRLLPSGDFAENDKVWVAALASEMARGNKPGRGP